MVCVLHSVLFSTFVCLTENDQQPTELEAWW